MAAWIKMKGLFPTLETFHLGWQKTVFGSTVGSSEDHLNQLAHHNWM